MNLLTQATTYNVDLRASKQNENKFKKKTHKAQVIQHKS